MGDATQKLVDEGYTPTLAELRTIYIDATEGHREDDPDEAERGAEFDRAIAALEAAQRPPVSPVLDAINDALEAVARGERPSIIIDTDDYPAPERPPVSGEYTHVVNLARASEAADRGLDALIDYLADLPTVGEWRPPVSPEQREAVRAAVGEQLTRAGLDLDGPPFADDGETQWPVALELRDRMTDAILARFSLPVLDGELAAAAARLEALSPRLTFLQEHQLVSDIQLLLNAVLARFSRPVG